MSSPVPSSCSRSTSPSARSSPDRDRGSNPRASNIDFQKVPSDSAHVTMFENNLSISPIRNVLAKIAEVGHLSAAKLRRISIDAMSAHTTAVNLGYPQDDLKEYLTPVACAMRVEEMAMATRPLFSHGSCELRAPQISAVACRANHVRTCRLCSKNGLLQSTCYYSPLDLVLTNGWSPNFVPSEVKEKYVTKNSEKVIMFPRTVEATLNKLIQSNIVRVSNNDEAKLVSTVNLIIKRTDIQWSRSRGMNLSNDDDLDVVNQARDAEGLPPIKARVVHDYTGSGLNGAQTHCRYSNIDISDLLNLVQPNCWFAVGDLASYYESFSLADDFLGWFCFQLFGVLYLATRIMFGFAPAPAYCATFTAEIISWISHLNINVVAMTDDYCIVAKSEKECKANMDRVVHLLSSCGFRFNDSKFQLGKKVVFIGFLVDSQEMTVSFHPDGVNAYLFVLRGILGLIRDGKKVKRNDLESLGGKLNHYSILIQQGRLHIHYIWRLIHDIKNIKRYRSKLIRDLCWWDETLSKLAVMGNLPHPFPIFCAEELRTSKDMVMVIRSDASGLVAEDPSQNGGWGFIAGGLNENNPIYKFGRWFGDYQFGPHSHYGELMVLKLFLEVFYTDRNERLYSPDSKIVFWVTDCASAAYSVNKGYCRNPDSLGILTSILSFCDLHSLWIVALWWPREEGKLEDLLTHMSAILNRDLGEGQAVDLARVRKEHC